MYETALKYYEEALHVHRKISPTKGPGMLSTMVNLGMMYEKMKEYNQAERCYSEAIAGFEKIYGKENFYYAKILNHLAILLP